MGDQDNKRVVGKAELSVKLSSYSVLAKVKVDKCRKYQQIEAAVNNPDNSWIICCEY